MSAKHKEQEKELKAKHKEALQDKEKEYRFKDLKDRIKQDRQELKERILNKTPPRPQGNQYTKAITNLQEQHKALTTDYANITDKDPNELKQKQLEAIKKQQENLNDQAYNIKQARLQNQSPLLTAEQKIVNRGAINQQVELYNKQRQNTIKNAMNIDKTANNIKDMATNINKNKIGIDLFSEVTKTFGLKTLALASVVTMVGKYLLDPLIKYDNKRLELMSDQQFANEALISFNQARALKKYAKDNQEPQLLQYAMMLGQSKITAKRLSQGFASVGMGDVRFDKSFNDADIFSKMMIVHDKIKEAYNKYYKTTPQFIERLQEMLTQSFGVDSNYFLRMMGISKLGGFDFLGRTIQDSKALSNQLENEKYQPDMNKVLDNFAKRELSKAKAEEQGKTADIFKLNTLSRALQKSDETLLKINEGVTRIAYMIDRYMQKQNHGVMDSLANYYSPNSFNTIPTPYGLSPSYNQSVTITNKANQGMPQ